MIKDNKKLNPFLGIAIGLVLTFFPILGMMFTPVVNNLGFGLFMLIAIPIISIGMFLSGSNAMYLGLRTQVRYIEKRVKKMNPMTSLNCSYAIMKLKMTSDLYITRFNRIHLNVVRMNEKTNVSVSWIRRVFLGSKLPFIFPNLFPVIAEFNGFTIRECLGKVSLYDIDENQWISGQATIFKISFNSKPLKELLLPETFKGLIDTIDRSK